MSHRRRLRRCSPMVVVGSLAACADDAGDATPTHGASRRRPRVAGTAGAVDPLLCPTVQAWSDAIVDAVRRLPHRQPRRSTRRRARRATPQAFAEQSASTTASAARRRRADAARRRRGRARPAPWPASRPRSPTGPPRPTALPDSAYDTVAVRDGKLLVGTEKSKAIVFNTLADLADDPARRAAGLRAPRRARPVAVGHVPAVTRHGARPRGRAPTVRS